MGSFMKMKCSKCRFKFTSLTGIGYMFPLTYKETVQKAKEGELGEELKIFFEEHPDGSINITNVSLCCDKCGNLEKGKDLTMYIPNGKEPQRKRWVDMSDEEYDEWIRSIKENPSVRSGEPDECYDEYAKYPHRCSKCNGKMHIVSGREVMKCPDCKIPLETVGLGCWD